MSARRTLAVRYLLALFAALAAAACSAGSAQPKAQPHESATTSQSPPAPHQQVVSLGQAGQAADGSGNAWRITVSKPVLVAAWNSNPDQGQHIVVYRVSVANNSGDEDVSSTDFEERVTGFPSNDLWSGGGAEASLQRFMSTHKFSPQPPTAGSTVSSGNATSMRTYFVAIRFSGKLSQVEFRPFGMDDTTEAPLVWR